MNTIEKEIDAVLQIYFPDDYYEELRAKAVIGLIDWHNSKIKKLNIPDVIWQSEQVGVCMHNLDMTGKCFKCGEQYIRKEG